VLSLRESYTNKQKESPNWTFNAEYDDKCNREYKFLLVLSLKISVIQSLNQDHVRQKGSKIQKKISESDSRLRDQKY
jgi:hypothetical protein